MSYFSVMFCLILVFRLLLSDFGFVACCFHGLLQLNLSHPTMCNDKEASVCDQAHHGPISVHIGPFALIFGLCGMNQANQLDVMARTNPRLTSH